MNTTENYDWESRVNVFPFTRQDEGEEVIIGRVETGVFLAVPRGAVEILEHLASGKSVGQASDLYREQHGEIPDISGLLAVLQTKGLVEPIGSDGLPPTGSISTAVRNDRVNNVKPPALKRHHFNNFSRPLAQRIFSGPMIGFCLILVAIAVFLVARDHSLWPNRDNLYIADHRALIVSLLVIAAYGSIIMHEFAHLIAARAVGVNARIGFGHRMYDFVIETDLTGLWSVPKRQRYLPLVAGSLLDATVGALMVFALYAYGKGLIHFSDVGLRVWETVLLTYIVRICWQSALFVRTDYYYVVATWLNCRNLLGDTEAFLRNQVSLIFPWFRHVDQSSIPASERRIIPFFAVLWVVGRIVALYWLFIFILPLWSRYLADVTRAFARYSADPVHFWGSLAMVVIVIGPAVLGLIIWIRSLTLFSLSMQRSLQHG